MPAPIALHSTHSSIVLSQTCSGVQIVFWGKRIPNDTNISDFVRLSTRQELPASPIVEVPLTSLPSNGTGYSAHPGIQGRSSDGMWGWQANDVNIEQIDEQSVLITLFDTYRNVAVEQTVRLCKDSDVLVAQSQIINKGQCDVELDWLNAFCLPIPQDCNQIIGFEGHWATEFQQHQLTQFVGNYVRENRRGRTSHDSFPALIMAQQNCDENQGACYGFHLGWSGNHKIVAEKISDGRAYVQMGELLLPGEISLKAGESYTSPQLFGTFSNQGLSCMSRQFHRYVRTNILKPIAKRPRPVHYNTWEGLYFDHDMPTLLDLVKRAQDVGAERFVLDDGWFIGRNHEQAGLGDWFVDEVPYPEGLLPLVEAVNNAGMEFGLWVEPEMVNPDSNLYRNHPDWVLSIDNNDQLPFRYQLVLDMGNQDVQDYLFDCIDKLLNEYNIAYLKWDMNRDLNHPGSNNHPSVHVQNLAVYALIDRVKASHPNVEIESCASGGARADFGVLAHTDRVWTSDNNDAQHRLHIQKGFSMFLPSNVMGSHIGPRDCHITHRTFPMEFRAAVAIFGHMGMEMDLRELTDDEQIQVKHATDLYKQHRALIHSGDLYRLNLPSYQMGQGIVADDKSEALYMCATTEVMHDSMPGNFKFLGLDEASQYEIDIIWPRKTDQPWPARTLIHPLPILEEVQEASLSGHALVNFGMQMPRISPQSAIIFHLKKI